MRLERGEQGQIIADEVVVLAGLVASTLVVTSVLMLAAAGFARMGNLLGYSHWVEGAAAAIRLTRGVTLRSTLTDVSNHEPHSGG